ncbi:hypothetical protein BVRB_026130 [Beta vulgaris subsp. vulgaris]|uniref:N-acetyltransferase domain-containing protein n=1 Tax=Beta vulgaris subsp. vulgaris TaxID=3555 RepID=A0A0J8B269_BETVV|nr:hypothetical protein BVRB_026130 [Beta vulgaris subsp. vulgaris]
MKIITLSKAKKLSDREYKLLQGCITIERRLFPKHESLAATLEIEARKQSQDFVIMFDDEEKVVGYMIVSRSGHICKIAVASDRQRQGFGRQLISWAKERHPALSLHVDPDRPAMKFYFTEQFQQLELLRDYYIAGRDAYLMKWHR